jgi:hypothetical protein
MLALLAGAATAHAQRAYWDPGHGTLGFGKYSELNLVFEDCTPSGEVTLPAITGLELTQPSISRQTSINFGQSSSRVVLSYQVQPTGRADIVIPAFDVRTDRGKVAVGEVRFTIGDATVGQSGLNVSDILTAQLKPSRATVWVGEVFDIEYQLLASPRFRSQIGSNLDWKPEGMYVEPFGEFEQIEGTVGNERRVGVRCRTRAVATTPGTLQLSAIRQTINVQTGERSGIFAQPRVESFTIVSDQPTITVRALPLPTPAGFTGAVGEFKLESKVVPQIARVGEPITWTVMLRGTGNWPANPTLPQREVSADFQVVQPQPRTAMDDGRLFSGSLTEDAVLVPTRAGSYTIGPIPFVWFDTAAGRFRDEPVPAVTLTIQPAVAAESPPATTQTNATAPDASGTETNAARPLPSDLAAPGQLPRDPLRTGQMGAAPGHVAWWTWFPLALATPALVWLGLAWRTMARSDSFLVRRAAQRELLRLLAPLARTSTAPLPETLATWRRLTGQLWMIGRATPTLEDLEIALARERHGIQSNFWTKAWREIQLATVGAVRRRGQRSLPADAWVTLWLEAEGAMFASARPLPADWVSRAIEAARSARIYRELPPLPLRARFWTPSTAGIVLAMALLVFFAPQAHAVDAGTRAYREGNFAAARAVWRIAVANAPHDWAARNNLALACAQQDDWSEATAHWTAAFLLHPREPSIRANLRLALTHLDGVDPELRRIVEGAWFDRWITALSPAEWQRLFVIGGILVAIALTLLVTTLYSPNGRTWRTRVGLLLVPVGVFASIAGITGRILYGPLGDPGAGLVAKATELRSIPTDLTENQQTSPIAAGAVVVQRAAFLGWERVDIARTGGGWLRHEMIVPFFAPPPKAADGEKL